MRDSKIMFRKKKKHQYFINGGDVPRSTINSRIKKAGKGVKVPHLPSNVNMGSQSNENHENEVRNTNATHSSDEDLMNFGPLTGKNSRFSICSADIIASPPPPQCLPTSIESISQCDTITDESVYHNYDALQNQGGESESDEDSGSINEAFQVSDQENYNDEEASQENSEEPLEDADGNLQQISDFVTPNCNSDNPNNEDRLLNNTLCPCSPTTAGDALLYCLSLGIRHNLTWVAMVDIMKMIILLYGYEAVSSSKYYLQKMLYKQKTAKYHLYCSSCETYLGVKGEEGVEYSCECSKDVETSEPPTSFFVSVGLSGQFRSLLQRDALANEILTYRFERKKLNDNAYEDIFDGEAYKNLCKDDEILSNPYNFSYTFNTDGVQMGKSSKHAAWPIFISVNELSPQNRKRHMIFAGVWVGKTQPNMRIFLKPFVDEANIMSEKGFFWTDSQNIERQSRAFPLCCIVDSAARYKLLNLISYTGYFGCTFCYQQAENTIKGRRFTIPKTEANLRTHQSMIKDMNEVFKQKNNPDKKKRVIKGCKGFTPLALMKYFSLDSSFVVDSMHNSYLGASKSHTACLLTTCRTEYYIGSPEKLFCLDARLCEIRTPTSITRSPRSIEEWKLWKASEWRSWLLCYVLVCLYGLIPTKYVHHLALFSTALYLLLQKSVTCADIQMANQYLRKYVYLTEVYFGKTAMVYNFHLLLHMCRGVFNFGPLWTHNAFSFEGENRHFMQMRTSTGHVAKQLVRRYSIFSQFPNLCEMYASSEKPLEFLNEITGKSLKSFTRQDGCVLIGNGKLLLSGPVKNCVESLWADGCANYFAFEKMFYKGVRYCTSTYAGGKQHDDSYVSLGPNLKARIESIVQIEPKSAAASLVLVVTPFTVMLPDFLRTPIVNVVHVKEIVEMGGMVAINPTMIVGQCVYIAFDDKKFVTDVPYGCYGD